MRICRVHIESIPGSPYSPSAKYDTPKLDRESGDDYDARTWRNHCTTNAEGQVCVPAMALKQAIDTAAQKLGMKVDGRRGATFKGFFTSGYFANGDIPISNGKILTPDDAAMVTIYANADGKRGSGTRVTRRFPLFREWHGVAELTIVDDIITPEVFEHHAKTAGMIVGIGRFRPQNGGGNGRFRIKKCEWQNLSL